MYKIFIVSPLFLYKLKLIFYTALKAHKEKADILDRWAKSKLAWEVERGTHAGRLTEVAEGAADSRESLMREMLELALRIEKALTALDPS